MSEGPSVAPAPSRWLKTLRDRWEIAPALMVIALRFAIYPGDERWEARRDWVLWVSAYWIFTALARRTRAWPWVTTLLVGVLAGIYLEGNLSITVETLRWNLWP